ncbi:MAG TPA: nitroreductase/quinone reductase family protein [Dehalococcoidia bacterium]|nr:nitroreductase/quinone reductase family protein [Dehalococcoidia bacterium]
MASPMERVFVGLHRGMYRLSGGRFGGRVRGSAVSLLTTTGRKSGKRRTIPLVYMEEEGRLLLAASNGGNAKQPVWYLNLVADPEVEIQAGGRRFRTTAEVLMGTERGEVWERYKSANSQFAGYEAKTDREIPVIAFREPTAD